VLFRSLYATRHGGNIVQMAIAPVVALVVVALGEWSEFVEQSSPFKYAPYFMLGWIVLGIVLRAATRTRVAAAEAASDPIAVTSGEPAAAVG